MYFMNPIALPVNSSPFYLLPKQHFCSSTDQLKFACRVIQFAYEFKHRIDRFAAQCWFSHVYCSESFIT